MRGFGLSNDFHYLNTMHPQPNQLFSGSVASIWYFHTQRKNYKTAKTSTKHYTQKNGFVTLQVPNSQPIGN